MTENLVLSNRYHAIERLAVGGMGAVWRGSDELLGRPIAIKLLRSDVASDEVSRGRFRNEARVAAALQHPGIAQVYDYGEQGEQAYLIMELVPGESLADILARTGKLNADATLDIVAQAARALQMAHARGVVHRDIKPGNLLLTADGTVKVTDFGIARVAENPSVTQTGMVMGTAHYVSPEQASGQPLTGAADLYSLGCVAYECLSGRTPFSGDTAVSIALQHLNAEPLPLPSDVPLAVRGLVEKLLSKRVHDRPSSAAQLASQAVMLRESLAMESANSAALPAAGAMPAEAGAQTLVIQPPPATLRGRTPVRGLGSTGTLPAQGDPPESHRKQIAISVIAAIVVFAGVLGGALLLQHHGNVNLRNSNQGKVAPPAVTTPSSSQSTSGAPVAPQDTPTSHPTSSSPRPRPTQSQHSASPTPSKKPTSSPTGQPTETATPPAGGSTAKP